MNMFAKNYLSFSHFLRRWINILNLNKLGLDSRVRESESERTKIRESETEVELLRM